MLLCCEFSSRLPENPLSMARYPVSVAMAGDMCTCAVKTNLLMENRTYLCELSRFGVLFFSNIFWHFPSNYVWCNIS